MMNSMLHRQMLSKYNCEKCRFSTKDPNKYRNHVSLHNDIKYACSHCDFASYTKSEFQRHLVTHTGKFPYTCGYCGYGAIRNDYIVKHIRRIHGDGKIQCSVSTLENDSIKASINITEAHLTAPNIQNILQNSVPCEDIIDLTTEMDSIGSSSYIFSPDGNKIAGDVEVEVISPVDQQLYPWIPLTVVAPSSFRVPPNCIAQVVEVKPVNSACHLVLKCLNVVETSLPNQPVHSEHIYEQKPLLKPVKPDISTKNITVNSDGPPLHGGCQANKLYPSNTLCRLKDYLKTNVTCPIDDTNEIMKAVTDDGNEIRNAVHDDANEIRNAVHDDANEIRNAVHDDANEIRNAVHDDANEITNAVHDDASEITNAVNDDANTMVEDLEEFSGGPIISAVFSLSSDSQNTIEGIQWDCPFSSPKTSQSNDDVDAPHHSLIPPASQEGPTASHSELNVQMDIDKSQHVIKSSVLESESNMEKVKECVDPEIQLSTMLVPKTSQSNEDVDALHSSLNPPASREGPTVSDSELNVQMDIDKSQEVLKSSVLESENTMEKVKQCVDPEIQLSTTLVPKTSQSDDYDDDDDDVDALHSSLNSPASQEEPTVSDSELNVQMEIDKSQDVLKSSVLESENNMVNVKECIDPEKQLSTTLVPTDVKSESQPFVPEKIRKGGRISDRLGKKETNHFSNPQTLFLSYDKRIVMQPLSCTMQSYNTMTSQVDKVTEELQLPVKIKKEIAKAKVKRLAAPALKSRYQPNMRTLRLHPFKVDQMAHTPCYNQPVVVLNHPDVESVEISNIMKAIRVFEGKILKISLSKQMCKYV